MTDEHEKELIRILGVFFSRGASEETMHTAIEDLYRLIGNIECVADMEGYNNGWDDANNC